INGRAGNDTISDGGAGNDTLNGGDGNDLIRIQRFNPAESTTVNVNAGDGDDTLVVDASSGGFFNIDMGAGDDTVYVDRDGTYIAEIILGSGSDDVFFNSANSVVLLDFETGDAGDQFHLSNFLTFRANGWDSSTNPFSAGFLELRDDGGLATLIFYENGKSAGGTSRVLATFENVIFTNFTAFNFGGFDPAGGGEGETFVGTPGVDTYTGTEDSDTINGLGGNDTLDGGGGDDDIDGGDGDDTILGGQGNDTLRGGAGDDIITDPFGANTIYGDGGNDTINITGYFGSSQSASPHQIFGGAGNDVVNYGLSSTSGLILDLGSGDDRINFTYPVGPNELTLGAGSDIVDIDGIQSISSSFAVTILDFETGDGGDQLVWEQFIRQRTGNTDPDFNPFSFNEVSLLQVGNDVHIVQGFTLVIFRDTQISDFTAFNLGFDPNAETPPGETFTGTPGRDFFEGTNRNDIMTGLGADDSLEGRGGDDELDGGAGNDLLDGGDGDDII
ncbi:MAG: hypothetical protein WBD31_31530, partial [Rubripirellula sp.]